MLSVRGPVAALALVLVVSSCTGDGTAPDPGPAPTNVMGDLVPTTARGLAAAVLTHVDADAVTAVGGSDRDGVVSVFVETEDPGVESVYVFLGPYVGQTCGADPGYVELSCTTRPALRSVLRRSNDRPRMPILSGTLEDEARGGVLVQIHGSGGPDAVSLVEALLDDPLVGRSTSSALEAEGHDLDPFEDLVITTELRSAPARDRPTPPERTEPSASPAPR